MNEMEKNLKFPDESSNLGNNEDSQIRKYYAGKVILLTGFTGFLGTIILEKLLRTCTEVTRIYVMIREKRGMAIEERLSKYFKNTIFDKLREANPNFMEKVVPIYGDLQKADLGFSPEIRRNIVETVNIIIHNASMVYFEAKISCLLRINVIGTQKMLELGLECSHLEVFTYVSTAYSHHYVKTIEEIFYPPPVYLDVIEDMIRADEENETGLSKTVVDAIVGKWTNIYAFSKAMAEHVVERFSRKTSLPCIVYRPSIIVPSYKEPVPQWVGNQNGPIKIMLSISLGILHVVHARSTCRLDTVPVDMATNSLLAIIHNYAVNRESNEPQVYNYASSDWNPVNLKMIYEGYSTVAEKYPSQKIVWYPFAFFVTNFFVFVVLHTLFHVIPGMLVDLYLIIQGKSAVAMKVLFALAKNHHVLLRFMNGDWTIKADKIRHIKDNMTAADSNQFLLDLGLINWYEEIRWGLLITCREAVKDPIETLPAARRKYQRLKIAHYTSCSLIVILFLYYLYRLTGRCVEFY
ncbi:fatty acyl-CoA reductase 1-like [Xylocopa sonorina]|uniref:fatty acyl-CoA reductase 1-like n=1 Tax=Xylocopa sonorina TaxID=1818115 RepID=UPI00403A8EC8